MPIPQRIHRYETLAFDSDRWDAFPHRPGDIVVCTSYKAGTTWTQMICALLIFQEPKLDRPIGLISPWLDMKSQPIEATIALYEAQTHRRFIKTHTAFDGIPYYEDAIYLFCGRDPRDIFMSLLHHIQNLNPDATADFVRSRRETGAPGGPRPTLTTDPNDLFRLWLTRGSFPWEHDGFPFWSVFHHAATFWAARDLPNVHFLHYSDLQADLEGQMRRLAEILGIEVAEGRWPALVEAACFESMRANADMSAPDTEWSMWRDNREFFHRGTNGQWEGVLSEESLALFDEVLADRVPPDLGRWLLAGGPVR
jgi:aryl sulfotransferase